MLGAAAVLAIRPHPAIVLRNIALPLACLLLALAAGAARIVVPLAGQDSDPHAILIELAKISGFAACAVTGLTIGGDRQCFARWSIWLIHAGGAYTLMALAIAAPIFVDPPRSLAGRFAGTLANANAAGCVFGMIALMALARSLALVRDVGLYRFDARHFTALAAAFGTTFFALAACAMSQSRVALAACVLLGLLLVIRDAQRHRARLWPIVVAGGVMLIALAALAVGGATADRFAVLATDAHDRWQGYRAIAPIVAEAPWLGHGLGSFSEVHLTHLTADGAPIAWNWGAAHNIVLHALIEGGLCVTLPIIALWGAIAVRIGRSPGLSLMVVAQGAALALVLACASVDVALNVPAIAAVSSLLLGAAWGVALRERLSAAVPPPRSANPPRAPSSPPGAGNRSRHTS